MNLKERWPVCIDWSRLALPRRSAAMQTLKAIWHLPYVLFIVYHHNMIFTVNWVTWDWQMTNGTIISTQRYHCFQWSVISGPIIRSLTNCQKSLSSNTLKKSSDLGSPRRQRQFQTELMAGIPASIFLWLCLCSSLNCQQLPTSANGAVRFSFIALYKAQKHVL